MDLNISVVYYTSQGSHLHVKFFEERNIFQGIKVTGMLLFTDGRCLLVNLRSKTVLHRFNFKKPVSDLKFSPNGR